MNSEVALVEAKATLREQVRARLRRLTQADRAKASTGARAILARQRIWQRARVVLFYAPVGEELDLWPLVEEALGNGKKVSLPRFDTCSQRYMPCTISHLDKDLARGKFGIREPASHCETVALNRLDLILVPGIAFDLHGRRLGRGKGFYDRLLADTHGQTCGVGYDQQIVPAVPVGPLDIHLNCILTPTRWIEL